jgi:hypothetical protein
MKQELIVLIDIDTGKRGNSEVLTRRYPYRGVQVLKVQIRSDNDSVPHAANDPLPKVLHELGHVVAKIFKLPETIKADATQYLQHSPYTMQFVAKDTLAAEQEAWELADKMYASSKTFALGTYAAELAPEPKDEADWTVFANKKSKQGWHYVSDDPLDGPFGDLPPSEDEAGFVAGAQDISPTPERDDCQPCQDVPAVMKDYHGTIIDYNKPGTVDRQVVGTYQHRASLSTEDTLLAKVGQLQKELTERITERDSWKADAERFEKQAQLLKHQMGNLVRGVRDSLSLAETVLEEESTPVVLSQAERDGDG